MNLKVCGMKYPDNISEVAALQPNYLGFIFWKSSKRFFDGTIPNLSDKIKKVGVFVDAALEEVNEKVQQFHLQAVQLHGAESPSYCQQLKQTNVEIIKVLSVGVDFDFSQLEPYEQVCDFYLFDTKGELPGGNGYAFEWKLLENYPSTKPYFLSGGIGLEDEDSLKEFFTKPESKHCYAIDVNSKFELEPGLKDIPKLKEFLGKF